MTNKWLHDDKIFEDGFNKKSSPWWRVNTTLHLFKWRGVETTLLLFICFFVSVAEAQLHPCTFHLIEQARWVPGNSSDPDTLTLYRLQMEWFDKLEFYRNSTPHKVKTGVFLDIETTGLEVKLDEIIEIALVSFEYEEKTGRITSLRRIFSGLHQPRQRLTPFIRAKTGLTDEKLKGRRIDWAKVDATLADAEIILSHNAAFDRPFVDFYSKVSRQKKWGCSMSQVDWFARGYPLRSLAYLTRQQGFYFGGHRAVEDAVGGLYLMAQESEGKPYFKEVLDNVEDDYAVISFPQAQTQLFYSRLVANGYKKEGKRWYKTTSLSKKNEEVELLAQVFKTTRDELEEAEIEGKKFLQVKPIARTDTFRSYSEKNSKVHFMNSANGSVYMGNLDPVPPPPDEMVLRKITEASLREGLEVLPEGYVKKPSEESGVFLERVESEETGEVLAIAWMEFIADDKGRIQKLGKLNLELQGTETPLSSKTRARLGYLADQLGEERFNLKKLKETLNRVTWIVSSNAKHTRPSLRRLLPETENKIWSSLENQVNWGRRGRMDTSLDGLLASYGYYTREPWPVSQVLGSLRLMTLPVDPTNVLAMPVQVEFYLDSRAIKHEILLEIAFKDNERIRPKNFGYTYEYNRGWVKVVSNIMLRTEIDEIKYHVRDVGGKYTVKKLEPYDLWKK